MDAGDKNQMNLYEPINVLKPVSNQIWIVDGPIIRMSLGMAKVPFPTRMVVIQLANGELFIWSPIPLEPSLKTEIDRLGPVAHIVSPNKLHYASIQQWKDAYPKATAWASPGVRKRAASQKIRVNFDNDLTSKPDEAWSRDIDHLIMQGNHFLNEVVFFHKSSKALIVADMIQNFEPTKMPPKIHWLLRFGGVCYPDGQTPLDLRLLFFGNKNKARSCLQQMIDWQPERLIVAHGHWYDKNGTAELLRAFRWLQK